MLTIELEPKLNAFLFFTPSFTWFSPASLKAQQFTVTASTRVFDTISCDKLIHTGLLLESRYWASKMPQLKRGRPAKVCGGESGFPTVFRSAKCRWEKSRSRDPYNTTPSPAQYVLSWKNTTTSSCISVIFVGPPYSFWKCQSFIFLKVLFALHCIRRLKINNFAICN